MSKCYWDVHVMIYLTLQISVQLQGDTSTQYISWFTSWWKEISLLDYDMLVATVHGVAATCLRKLQVIFTMRVLASPIRGSRALRCARPAGWIVWPERREEKWSYSQTLSTCLFGKNLQWPKVCGWCYGRTRSRTTHYPAALWMQTEGIVYLYAWRFRSEAGTRNGWSIDAIHVRSDLKKEYAILEYKKSDGTHQLSGYDILGSQ